MSREPTDALIRSLASELPAVRRIPPLRAVAAASAALLLPGVGWQLIRAGGMRADLAALTGNATWVSVALGLGLAGLGGFAAATAGSVPGRERLARSGRAVVVAGGALALGLAPLWIAGQGLDALRWPGAPDWGCLVASLEVGLLAALAGAAFCWWAAPRRIARAVALAVAAGSAAGGLAVHASCPAQGALHWVFGHAAAPLAGGLLALAVTGVAAAWRRRS